VYALWPAMVSLVTAGDSEIYWLSLHNWDGPALAAETCR